MSVEIERMDRCCVGYEGRQIEHSAYAVVHHHRQGPGHKLELPLHSKQNDEKEYDGDEPRSDSHKHDPAVFRQFSEGSAGYQRPVQQAKNYFCNHEEGWGAPNEDHVHPSGDLGGEPTQAVAPLLRVLGIGGTGLRSYLGRKVCHYHKNISTQA